MPRVCSKKPVDVYFCVQRVLFDKLIKVYLLLYTVLRKNKFECGSHKNLWTEWLETKSSGIVYLDILAKEIRRY